MVGQESKKEHIESPVNSEKLKNAKNIKYEKYKKNILKHIGHKCIIVLCIVMFPMSLPFQQGGGGKGGRA